MESTISIDPRTGWRRFGGETVAFSCESQQLAVWNQAASLLWTWIDGSCTRDSLARRLSSEYSLPADRAVADTEAFLAEALALGFLARSGPGNSSCPVPPKKEASQKGAEVLLHLEMHAIKHCVPFAVTLETTYACNEACIHCFMDRRGPSLRTQEIRSLLEDLAAEGCLFLSLTGGEFLLRPDALELIEFAAEHHFVLDILSNGTLLTAEITDTLARLPVRRLQVSVYGASDKTHDYVTRTPGSFRRTVRGIEAARQAGLKVELAFPLMGCNFDERVEVVALADSLDCLLLPSPMITARNDGRMDTFQLRLDDAQLREFLADKYLSSLYSGRKPFEDHQYYLGIGDLLNAAPCYSGFNTCAITPAGKVLPCNQLLFEVGDIRERSFSSIWRSSQRLGYLRSLSVKDLSECSGCELLHRCARCPGLAMLEGNGLLGASPENCRISRVEADLRLQQEELTQ